VRLQGDDTTPPTLLPDGSRDVLTVVREMTVSESTSHLTLIMPSIAKPYMRASTRLNYPILYGIEQIK
jgi:hypothetical protein